MGAKKCPICASQPGIFSDRVITTFSRDMDIEFCLAVYDVVRQIPHGRVTNYGHVAYLLGRPKNSRHVGSALKNYHVVVAEMGEEDNVPWWRVVSSSGKILPRGDAHGEHLQADKLKDEGVEVNHLAVSMSTYGWFPLDIDF